MSTPYTMRAHGTKGWTWVVEGPGLNPPWLFHNEHSARDLQAAAKEAYSQGQAAAGQCVVIGMVRMRDGSLGNPEAFIKKGDAFYPVSRVFSGPGLPESAVYTP